MDGYITIGTRIDDSGLKKDYKRIVKEYAEKIKKDDFTGAGLFEDKSADKYIKYVDKIIERFNELNNLKKELLEKDLYNKDLGAEGTLAGGLTEYTSRIDSYLLYLKQQANYFADNKSSNIDMSKIDKMNQDYQEVLNLQLSIAQTEEEENRKLQNKIILQDRFKQLLTEDVDLIFQEEDASNAISSLLEEQGISYENMISTNEGRLGIILAIADALGLETDELGNIDGYLTNIPEKVNEINNNVGKLNLNTAKIGNSIEGVIKKIKRWTLSILGISTAYQLVKKSISLLSENNEQFKIDIEYIGWSLKQGVLAILEMIGITAEKVINVIKRLLFYIAYIIKQWTGKNIFENASLDKYNKSLKKTSGALKEIKKQLAGFDEANILNDNGSVNGIGGGLPSFDLSNWAKELEQFKPPDWVDWIAKNKKLIEDLALTALGIFGVATIGSWLTNIGAFLGSSQLSTLGSSLTNLGVIAGGIMITTICAQKVWQELDELGKDLKELQKKADEFLKGWIESEPEIDDVLQTWLTGLTNVNNMYKGIDGIQWDLLEAYEKLTGKDSTRLKLLKEQSNRTKEELDYVLEEYNQGKLNINQRKNLITVIKGQISQNNTIISKLKEEGKSTKEIEDNNVLLEQQLFAVSKGIKLNEDSTNLWATAQKSVRTEADGTVTLLDEIQNTKLDDKVVKVGTDLSDYETSMNDIETSKNSATVDVSANTSKMQSDVKTALKGSFNSIMFKPNVWTQGALSQIGTIFNIKPLKNLSLASLFKFAKGGIINQPGTGVPVGIAGEAGREGIIPLSDASQMELLGQMIGKYVHIDNVIDVSMDSYKINRILKKSEERVNFSANR